MKTKKISWQAIAIVVLALVLIASIALGVSGAWFQDSDSVDSTATMGQAVTVRLSGTETEGTKPVTWTDKYKAGRAYPGDTILGETKILLGSETMSIVRVKISAKIYDGEVSEGNEITTANVATKAAASTVPSYYDKGADAWKTEYQDSFNALNGIMQSAKVTSEWSSEVSEKGWFYFSKLANNATKTKNLKETPTDVTGLYLFDTLSVPVTVTNAAQNWNIVVSLEVEAAQAANVNATQVPTGWDWSDIPTTLQGVITNYNSDAADGRLK